MNEIVTLKYDFIVYKIRTTYTVILHNDTNIVTIISVEIVV